MVKGMACYFHPEKQSVAQCLKCGKGICKSCVDRYNKASYKYAGLCRDCILEAGIKCKDHPSKQAEIYCEKCEEPICGDCYGNVYSRFCYKCATDSLKDEIRENIDWWKEEKNKRILIFVFSIIGLIIGVIVSASSASRIEQWLGGIWAYVGISGNFGIALLEFPGLYRFYMKEDKFFLKALISTLFISVLFLLLKSLAGPIIPIVKIVKHTKDMRTAEILVVDATDCLTKLADYYTYTQYIEKHGDNVDLTKLTEQGGALYNNAYANAVLNGNQKTYWESK